MKKKVVYVIIFIITCLIITSVFLISKADEITANLSSSQEGVDVGKEITITLRLEEYTNIKKGIYAFKGTLVYDKSIFEDVMQNDITLQNNWEELKYNSTTGEFVAIKKSGSKEEEDIASIKLKVKREAEAGKSEVKIKECVASEGKEDINIKDAVTNINIIKEQGVIPEGISSSKYRIEPEYISRIAPETTVKKFLENVVVNGNITFTSPEGIILGEDDKIATGTRLNVGSSLEYTLIVIGDIDQDNQITVNDLADAKLHLIDYKILNGIALKAADVDDDGEVTINDVAQIKMILIDLLEIE